MKSLNVKNLDAACDPEERLCISTTQVDDKSKIQNTVSIWTIIRRLYDEYMVEETKGRTVADEAAGSD
jgi:hypothetical protein